MTNAVVISLREPGRINPKSVLTGPLTEIRRERLPAGQELTLTASGAEFTLLVLSGAGTASTESTTVPLSAGVSVTVLLDTELTLSAAAEGLELFVAELEVKAGGMA